MTSIGYEIIRLLLVKIFFTEVLISLQTKTINWLKTHINIEFKNFSKGIVLEKLCKIM
jgi:hypothetical protein